MHTPGKKGEGLQTKRSRQVPATLQGPQSTAEGEGRTSNRTGDCTMLITNDQDDAASAHDVAELCAAMELVSREKENLRIM